MSKLTTRKLAGVLVASALILSSSVALSASADAAGKQGTACTKLKVKSGTYTCIANPLKTTPKNIWATKNCADAQAAYQAGLVEFNSNIAAANNAITQTSNELASYQNALTVANTQLDNLLNNNFYTIEYDAKTHLASVKVQGFKAAIDAHTAKLNADQAGLAAAQAALLKDVAGSQKAKDDQATISAYMLGINYRQGRINDLNKNLLAIQNVIPKDQNAIVQWTTLANNAVAQKKSITVQFKPINDASKLARTSACKTGL